MSPSYYSIQDVEYALGVPRHKINYAMQTHKVCKVDTFFGGQRMFTDEDIRLLKEHFQSKEQ